MSVKTHHNVRNWIIAGAPAVAAIIGAAAYFFPPGSHSKTPDTEIKATGRDSIAAGRDVSIKESTTVDEHDYDSDRRRDAEGYLSTARDACASLVEKIAGLTVDSPFDMGDPGKFMALGVEPTQVGIVSITSSALAPCIWTSGPARFPMGSNRSS